MCACTDYSEYEDRSVTRDEMYMRKALELAALAADEDEVPVGAVVVKKSTGEIVGRGFNRREYGRSPLTHAEIVAIDEASRKLGGWRLIDCELFVTLEPCPMCAGAVINSRVERVVFGAYDKKQAPAVRWWIFLVCPITINPNVSAEYLRRSVLLY